MIDLTQDQIDRWAARLIGIFKNGQAWEDTDECFQSYVRGIVEGLAHDVWRTTNEDAIQQAYQAGFEAGYKARGVVQPPD